MGPKIKLFFSLVVLTLFACQCPKNERQVMFTDSQNHWLSQLPPVDSVIQVQSDNGLSDILFIDPYRIVDSKAISSTNGSCPEYQSYESKGLNYFSKLSGFYFDFKLNSSETPVLLHGNFYRGTLPYRSCYFKVLADSPDSVSYFYYYPYEIQQRKGMQWVGDTIIKAHLYQDLYRFDINLNPIDASPLDVKVIYFSKSQALIAFKTYNGANWYLFP